MYDKERVGLIIRDIEDYLGRIGDVKIKNVDELDEFKFDAISMRIFFVVNRVIDLGKEIIIAKDFGMPKNYGDIFRILANKKFISKEQERDLLRLVFLRNQISHRYEGLSEEELFRFKNDLRIVRDFVKLVREDAR